MLVLDTVEKVNNFKAESGVLVVSATWCGPCKVLKEKYEGVDEVGGKQLAVVDIGLDPQMSAELQVRTVPTVIVFDAGVEVDRGAGIQFLESLSK